MKESLFDILNSHHNWEADIMEPATNREACATLDKEIKQAAALYADSLLPLADRWQKAVEDDINQIFTTEPPHTHFNKDRQERYRLTVHYFVGAVKRALKGHGFDISQLDRVTQWRLGENLGGWPESNTQTQDGLSRDEADRLLHKMRKQGYRVRYFRELCSNLYTVLAYKVEASQTMPPDTPPAAGQIGEAGQKPKNLPGAKETNFMQYVLGNDDEDNRAMLSYLHTQIDNKQPAQAALILAAAIEADWVSIKVTAPSIEREFDIPAASIKPHLTKYRKDRGRTQPYYTQKELQPYIDLFKG